MNDINWYPGHMAKARKILTENLKLIDLVLEVVDARAPLATRNPDFDSIFNNKLRVILLNKADLADDNCTKEWVEYYRLNKISAIPTSTFNRGSSKEIVSLINESAKPLVEKMRKKGVVKTVRAMVVGIPNVGKSTIINRIAGRKSAKTGNKPGVTLGKQWVGISDYLEIMDTPGMLWPKIEDQTCALHLAFLGSIKDELFDPEELAVSLLHALYLYAGEKLLSAYPCLSSDTIYEDNILDSIALSRNMRLNNREPDTKRAALMLIEEYRSGNIGKITLERPAYCEQNQ